jgi:hypothetical protein
VEMLKNENLDVRTVTLGISLRDCASVKVAPSRAGINTDAGSPLRSRASTIKFPDFLSPVWGTSLQLRPSAYFSHSFQSIFSI